MNAIAIAPPKALTGRIARNKVRARLGTARGTAPVRRRSKAESDHDFVDPTRPMSIGERRFLMRLLETYAQEKRGAGGKSPLTASALQVARTMLFVLMDRQSGRLEHAYSWIAKQSRRAYQTACSGVGQLEQLGVLVVQRRCRPGESPDAPPWVQDRNLYAWRIPEKLRSWWNARQAAREARARERAPEDLVDREARAAASNEAQEAEWQRWQGELARAEAEAQARHRAAVVQGPGAGAYRAAVARRFGPS